MKKHFNKLNILLVLSLIFFLYAGYDWYNYNQFRNKVDAVNKRIEYLVKEEGYTVEAAKHIADVEFGIVPADAEYKALMED